MEKVTTTFLALAPKVLYVLALVECVAQAIHGSFVGALGFGVIASILHNCILFPTQDDDRRDA